MKFQFPLILISFRVASFDTLHYISNAMLVKLNTASFVESLMINVCNIDISSPIKYAGGHHDHHQAGKLSLFRVKKTRCCLL